MGFVRVASRWELLDGEGMEVEAEGRDVALFKVKGEYFAISNTCLHMGGPLGAGDLEGYKVTCPLHEWQYDVWTGVLLEAPEHRVRTYMVRVDGNSILVDIEQEAAQVPPGSQSG